MGMGKVSEQVKILLAIDNVLNSRELSEVEAISDDAQGSEAVAQSDPKPIAPPSPAVEPEMASF
jgi:hypothetical protein